MRAFPEFLGQLETLGSGHTPLACFGLCDAAIMDVMPVGRGVVEWTDYKAKAEIQVLVQELIDNE